MNDRRGPRSPARRRFVRSAGEMVGHVAVACCCAPLLTLATGCDDSGSTKLEPLTVALDDLPLGVHTRYMLGDRPVELYRTFDGIRARILWCTHQGCAVRWIEDQDIYLCPCHDGQFDKNGQPIYGPPREPLRELDVTLTETHVIVGG
jgi:cytochrome b6-f complex iron-sulfur subunit